MRLLITGAAGTIGTRLAADLAAQGMLLRLLDRRACAVELPVAAEFVQADLRDLDAVEKASTGVSTVVHLWDRSGGTVPGVGGAQCHRHPPCLGVGLVA